MWKSRALATMMASMLVTACAAPMPTVRPGALAGSQTTTVTALARSETAAFLKEEGVPVSAAEQADLENTFARVVTFATAPDMSPAPATSPVRGALPDFVVNPVAQTNDTSLYLDDSEIFPELFRLIRGAKKRIQVSYFLLGGDIGMNLAAAMVERSKAGVEIQIMLDPKLGLSGDVADGVARVVAYLKANNVNFKLYPLALFGAMPNSIQRKFQINHNKIAVFDGETAFVGSMNLDDLARINHDLMVRIEGPTAKEYSAMLDEEWAFGTLLARGGMATQAVSQVRITQTAPQQRNTKESLLKIIAGAQRSIHVAMYEFGDADMAAALCNAYKRGIDVRVILDPKGAALTKYGAGIMPDGMPNILPARELLKVGAQVRWFKPWRFNQELHMKAMVVDGRTLVAGSTNWTTNAFTRWRETSFIVDGGAALAFEDEFTRMWNGTTVRIDRLNLKQRLTARLCEYMNRRDIAFW